ncbi:MAG: M42 family peptidase [Thermoprotei archaeon]|nr:MAG: M42 family peptidase [Thermoprotei archaeon]
MVDALKMLAEAFGPSGHEDEVRELVVAELKKFCSKVLIDTWGNVIAVRYGRREDLKLMIAAHMDEIALMVKAIEKNGFIRFTGIGGWSDRVLPGQRVVIRTRDGRKIYGVIGAKPPHVMTPEEEEKKVIEMKDLFIDVGASSAEEVRKLGIEIGCVAVMDRDFKVLGNGKVATCKAFDDRVGVAVMLTAARLLKNVDTEVSIYFVATVQEEVGLRGAMVSAYRIEPNIGIAIDVTVAGDVPGAPESEFVVRLGRGPAIKVMDRARLAPLGLIAHPKVKDFLIKVAEEEKIPYQLEVLVGGTTDAAAIAFTRGGVPAGVVSIPTRYVHSPVEVISLEDAFNAAKLVAAAARRVDESLVREVSLREV